MGLSGIVMAVDEDFLDFGNIVRTHLGKQAQYGVRFVDGSDGYPKLGEGLRFQGDLLDYHTLAIHRNDVQTFLDRYQSYLEWRDDPEVEHAFKF